MIHIHFKKYPLISRNTNETEDEDANIAKEALKFKQIEKRKPNPTTGTTTS